MAITSFRQNREEMNCYPCFQIPTTVSTNTQFRTSRTKLTQLNRSYYSPNRYLPYLMSSQNNSSAQSEDPTSSIVGTIRDGIVTKMANYGAFIDIGNGQTGLVHISEIAHSYINSISDHLNVGQAVKVKVLSIDNIRNRISLSIKQASEIRTEGYERIVELGGDWGHPWGDDNQTKFMDLGPRPQPEPHIWQSDPKIFEHWKPPQQGNSTKENSNGST